MIIDNTKAEFNDIPSTLNNEVLLERLEVGGFITCTQEIAYIHSVATVEQATAAGHNLYDYSRLDKTVCNKPNIAEMAGKSREVAQDLINKFSDTADKVVLQDRINSLLTAAENLETDSAIRLILQLQLDLINADI